jgi:hypothetical protein
MCHRLFPPWHKGRWPRWHQSIFWAKARSCTTPDIEELDRVPVAQPIVKNALIAKVPEHVGQGDEILLIASCDGDVRTFDGDDTVFHCTLHLVRPLPFRRDMASVRPPGGEANCDAGTEQVQRAITRDPRIWCLASDQSQKTLHMLAIQDNVKMIESFDDVEYRLRVIVSQVVEGHLALRFG